MRCLLFTLLLIPIQLAATTFYVDGPGDGNGNGNDDYDTVHDALIAFGPLGIDGLADEILITVFQVHEEYEWILNGRAATMEQTFGGPGGPFPPLHDDLRIAGASIASTEGRVIVDIQPFGSIYYGWAGIEVYLSDGQDLVFENLTMMPTFTGGDVDRTFISINPSDEDVAQTGSLTFRNVWCVPSLNGNVPSDPEFNSPESTQIEGDNESVIISGRNLPDVWHVDSVVDHVFETVVVANHAASSINIEVGGGDIVVDGCRILHNNSGSDPSAFILAREAGGDTTIRHSQVIDTQSAFVGVPTLAGESSTITIGPGVEVYSETGLSSGVSNQFGRVDYRFVGSEEEPIVSWGSDLTGVGINAPPGHTFHMENVIVYGSDDIGLTYLATEPSGEAVISNCLFAGNAIDPRPWLTIANQVRQSVVGDYPQGRIVYENCTFHDVVKTAVGAGEINTQIAFAIFPAGEVEYELRNCIFSGGLDETAVHIYLEASQELVIRDSATVMEGPDALGSMGDAGSGMIELINCTFADPMYVQTTDPDAPGYFDVQNPAFATAGPDGGPLTGWGDYVGPLPPFEPSGLEMH